LLVGDSLAVGLANPLALLGMQFDSLAVSGTSVQYWTTVGLANLQLELEKKPTSVFIVLGTNDAFNGTAYASTAAAATAKLLAVIKRTGALIFWVGPPSLPASYRGKSGRAVIAAIRDVVERTPDATWIDSSKATIERSADGLHPTMQGYYYWADLLVDELAGGFVSPTEVGQISLGEDTDEPMVRPAAPSIVLVPAGWAHSKTRTPAMTAFAVSVLAKRNPIGHLERATIEGSKIGALTEWHWDNHVGGQWKWHRGISLLAPTS